MITLVDLIVALVLFYAPLSAVFLMILDNDLKEMKRQVNDLEWKLHQIEKKQKS